MRRGNKNLPRSQTTAGRQRSVKVVKSSEWLLSKAESLNHLKQHPGKNKGKNLRGIGRKCTRVSSLKETHKSWVNKPQKKLFFSFFYLRKCKRQGDKTMKENHLWWVLLLHLLFLAGASLDDQMHIFKVYCKGSHLYISVKCEHFDYPA